MCLGVRVPIGIHVHSTFVEINRFSVTFPVTVIDNLTSTKISKKGRDYFASPFIMAWDSGGRGLRQLDPLQLQEADYHGS